MNLNIHLHMLVLGGVYTLEQNRPRFHRAGAPNRQALARLLNRFVRRLTRDGLLIEDPEQPWLDLEPSDTLDQLNAASIRYRIAVGQGAGGRNLTLKNPYRDGTTHTLFSPADFIARLTALVPRLPPTRAGAHETPRDLFAESWKARGVRPAGAQPSWVSRKSLLRGRQRPH